jgi:predicted methyltransferase
MRGLARTSLGAFAIAVFVNGCTMQAPPPPPPDYAALLAAPDRTDADRKNDDRRHAAQLLAFTGVRPGWKVLDMAADAGYSTELMARAVAPGGTVYGQNPPDTPPRALNAFLARMQRPAMKDVVDDRRAFDDPVPPNVTDLDLVTFFFGYHDTTYMKVDRAKMDKAMFDALKPGGYLVIADYAALPGAPVTTGKTFHRLDENIEKSEVEAAGFKLVDEGNFLRNPNDTHDFVIFNSKIPIDIFVLKFQKPN